MAACGESRDPRLEPSSPMPVYKAKQGRWRVVIFLQGHRQDFQLQGSKKDATAFEARKRAELEAAGPATMSRVVPRFADFCVTRYRAQAELNLKASTWKRQRYILEDLIEELGGLKLNEIGAAASEDYARKRKKDGLSAISVNNELRVLRRILNYAKAQGVPGASGEAVKQIAQREPERVKVWTAEEIASLFNSCKKESPAILPLVVFLANTGCRRGEALALTWNRVNLERRMVEIWPSESWQPKSGKPREVPISDALLPWLQPPLKARRWVFPSSAGERFADWPARTFDRARDAAGLIGGVHTLRHTFASHFLQNQPDMFLLAQVLGHSDTAVTKLYSHLLPGHLDRARNAVSFAP